MQAVILAAGMGKRLKHLTQDNTKCMVKVNNVSLIDRLLHQLEKQDLKKIIIVAGYEREKLKEYINTLNIKTKIEFIDNPIYDKTNNIYSLSLAKDNLCEDDTLLFESDLIFDDSLIDLLVTDPYPSLTLVDKYQSWMDGTCVTLDEEDNIIEFVPGKKFDFNKKDKYYKTVNIYKFSKEFSQKEYVPFLEAYTKALGLNEYYEQVLKVITQLEETELKAKRLDNQKWYEIDDEQDLEIAATMFNVSAEDKLKMIQSHYGGYWRYPNLLDFCYLVNPYFPTPKMLNELKSNFMELLTQYPSGMKINSLLAAKNFGIDINHIVVGNGAAELIKNLMEDILANQKVGVIRPTFEEYPNRLNKENVVCYKPSNNNFSYTVEDIINYFKDKDIKSLLLINPDNPTGNFIDKDSALKLADWTKENNIRLIFDESFIDFAEDSYTFIDEDILNKYNNMYVVKSISKSFGVPGLRLGVLASSDTNAISLLKSKSAIWNINSFAENYMQIYEKYKKDYSIALEKIKEERERFANILTTFKDLRVIPSQANYIMVELLNNMSAKELTIKLLNDYEIFIKDLSSKVDNGEYLRLAVRNTEDNDTLIKALKKELK